MPFKSIKISVIFFLLVCSFFTQAQNYGDKNYYLVDSLDLNNIIPSEKELIQNSLSKYYNAKSVEFKLKAINSLIENSFADSVWPKYNQWMYDYTEKELGDILPITNINDLNTKQKMILKYYSKSINNFG